MTLATFLVQVLTGMSHAATLFLVAAGLSLIFGVTRIVNFAHGSFYMLGAYCAYSLSTRLADHLGAPLGFWAGIVCAAVAVGLAGVIMEVLLLRRIYHAPELFQLLGTFGVVLIVQDAALAAWGREDLLAPRAPGFKGTLTVLGERIPEYHLLLIVLAPVVLGIVWVLFHRTRWGVLVRATTADREMAGALGVNQRLLFTTVLFAGCALAGLGGALQIPLEPVNLQMDVSVIAETFVVVVVGGMGSIVGAFLAALLIGEVHAFGVLLFPKLTLVLVFLVMAAVLIVRPHGLLGKAEPPPARRDTEGEATWPVLSPALRRLAPALLALLALAPWLLGEYTLVILTEILILALFAASLHLIMHFGGLASFGHAAYFGIGAYAAALTTKAWALPPPVGLVVATATAGLAGLLFGRFCARQSGVYLAMLSLAFAQIVWSILFQSAWTGGDNGILGLWPAGWLADKRAWYGFVLVMVTLLLAMTRRAAFASFGYMLRATRDSALRAEAIGIDVARQRWLAFTLSGALAGCSGGLFAYHAGSVFPDLAGMGRSLDALIMVLLGGVHTLSGPLVGAAVFHALKTELVRLTDYWRVLLGVMIVLLVVLFPRGIAGYIRDRAQRRGGADEVVS